MQEQFGDIAKTKKFRLQNRTPRIFTPSYNQNINSVRTSRSNSRDSNYNKNCSPKTSFQSSTNQQEKRSVRFSDVGSSNTNTRKKKHHSTSILKKGRYSSTQRRMKTRTDSVNSLAGQNPHRGDQSCQNSNLNKIIKEDYLALLQNYGKKGNYVDDIFPPVISSLFSYATRKKNKIPEVKWMRLSQVFPQSQLVMWSSDSSKITISKTSTSLAPQYFTLAMNCIKGSKQLLRFMFESQQPNPQGIYYTKIFQGSIWKYIIIDDYIPVIQQQQILAEGKIIKNIKPAFLTITTNGTANSSISKNSRNPQTIDIWPFLIQKAFAKLYSSYQALQNGNIFDFLQQLTNKPCEYMSLQEKILDKFCKNYDIIAFAELKKQQQNEEEQEVKVSIHSIPNSDKVSFILNNTNNPFQKQQKRILSVQELPEYFDHLYLFSRTYTFYGYCPIRQVRQSISVRFFELKNAANCSISVLQKDQRYFQKNFKYQYSWVRLLLLQKQTSGYRWIDGKYDNTKSLHIETYLQPGQYFVLIMPQWQKKSYDLNLIIRTKTPIRIQRRVYQDGMIEEACTDLAQRFGKLNQHNSFICSYNCIHQSMGFIIQNINNQRMKGFIRIVRSIQGLQCSQQIQPINKQFTQNKTLQIKIKSGSHYTIVLMMKKGVDQNFFKNFDFQQQ